jgi:hypothetical protein
MRIAWHAITTFVRLITHLSHQENSNLLFYMIFTTCTILSNAQRYLMALIDTLQYSVTL